MMNPEARVEQLDRELKLTADQKAKLTDIFTKSRSEMEAMRDNKSGDREANREKMQSMMQATQSQVQAVLTDEQKQKLSSMRERGGDRPRGGQGEKGGGQGGRRKKGE